MLMLACMNPETVGNIRRVLISDLSGKSNIDYKARELGFKFSNNKDGKSRELAQWVKNMAYNSYQFDGAEASFELVIQEQFSDYKSYFNWPILMCIFTPPKIHCRAQWLP